jgi:sporulation protein YlmC with PRC-barrel domain
MLDSYSHEQLRELVGHEVRDREGRSIGFVDVVFTDADTGQLEWLGLWNGLPGGKRHLVPLQEIVHEADEIRVPWTKDQVESAPTYDEDDERSVFGDEQRFGISQEKEDEAYRTYGLERPAEARAGGPRLRIWIYEERAERIVR